MKIQTFNNWQNIAGKDRLDLVFEHRFTEYGAYQLRRNSSRNTFWATKMFLS